MGSGSANGQGATRQQACTISFLRSDGIESSPVSVTLSDYTEIGLPSGQENATFSIRNSKDSSANQLISNWVEPGDCQ